MKIMKKLLMAVGLVMMCGCAALDRAVLEPGEVTVEQREVVTVEEHLENLVSATGQEITRTNFVVVTNVVQVPVTNWAVSPAVQAGLEMAGVAASATPYGALAAPVLGTLSALLGWYATMRNRKYKEAASALEAVIVGVERSAEILGSETGGKVKAAIRNEAEASGAQAVLHRTVRELV